MKISIKEAGFDDLHDLAQVHVESWQQAYIGLVPQEYLDSLSIDARQKKWEEIFPSNIAENKHLYIAYDDGQAVGFISFGPNRDERKGGFAEIYAVYLLRKCWGKGIGYMLFEKTTQKLLKDGITKAYLWALSTNQNALASYKKWGGLVDETMITYNQIGGQDVKDIMVNFDLH